MNKVLTVVVVGVLIFLLLSHTGMVEGFAPASYKMQGPESTGKLPNPRPFGCRFAWNRRQVCGPMQALVPEENYQVPKGCNAIAQAWTDKYADFSSGSSSITGVTDSTPDSPESPASVKKVETFSSGNIPVKFGQPLKSEFKLYSIGDNRLVEPLDAPKKNLGGWCSDLPADLCGDELMWGVQGVREPVSQSTTDVLVSNTCKLDYSPMKCMEHDGVMGGSNYTTSNGCVENQNDQRRVNKKAQGVYRQ